MCSVAWIFVFWVNTFSFAGEVWLEQLLKLTKRSKRISGIVKVSCLEVCPYVCLAPSPPPPPPPPAVIVVEHSGLWSHLCEGYIGVANKRYPQKETHPFKLTSDNVSSLFPQQ